MPTASEDSGRTPPWRPILVALVLAVLVAAAGCSGVGGTNGSVTDTTATTAASPTTAADTATASPTVSPTAVPTTTDGSSPSPTPGNASALTGQMTVVVGANEVPEGSANPTAAFSFDGNQPHTWHAATGVTLSDALSTLGIDATADTLRYQGRTYQDGTNNTTVDIRVNGKHVDPTSYTLANGDEVWVTVETPGMNRSTPGTYIDDSDQHIHGHLAFVVNGQAVNFSRPKYQNDDRFFHFEGGSGASWHAHSWSITLQYALSSLDGIQVSSDGSTVTYDGTTYRSSDPGTTITIEVNGNPVQPGSYYLKDWDHVRVEIQSSG